MTIKLYYDLYSHPKLGNGNLGDVLSEKIFSSLFGVEASQSEMIDAQCCAIGSVLDRFLEGKKDKKYASFNTVNVWGSGFISEGSENLKFAGNLNFFAVRGLYTKKRLEALFKKELNDVVLGDPGLLASLLIEEKVEKKYKLGIIPHFIDHDHPVFLKINQDIEGSKIINIVGDPLRVIKEISQCEVVISTALHGLIVSDSLGIPNVWCEISNNVTGDGYKFRDYYSVFNIDDPKCIDLRSYNFDSADLQKIKDSYLVSKESVSRVQNNLIACFPYKNLIQSDKKVKNKIIKRKGLLSRVRNSVKRRLRKLGRR